MPVFLNAKHQAPEPGPSLDWPSAQSGALEQPGSAALHIGLVNNTGDGAMCATEHHFFRLLAAASGDLPIHVTLYALPGVERNAAGQRRVDSLYSNTERLWELPPEQRPDGLIVTGREPRTADLRDETYWPGFKRLLAWTQEHKSSTVWSCLAAHAAVLALDGIGRARSPQKHFGVFRCEQTLPHPLLAGVPSTLSFPHSRWNGLSALELAANGYRVLTTTCDGGVDTFVKEDAGLSVFFQGHPEYEAETLMGEYRRDVGRYLRGEVELYPLPPANYFDEWTERSLREIEVKARASRREDLLAELSAVLGTVRIHNAWQGASIQIYRNWLQHLCTQKRWSTPIGWRRTRTRVKVAGKERR